MEMYQIYNQIKFFIKEMEQDEEFYKINASMAKKMLDAYMEEGFTREEALTLVSKLGNGFNKNQR